ncbi:hypothetical protein JB92DRAFT_3053445 [Gautieria morchelliformis]|nr:hypothetical protein JB92DRAFT_3053445 [Gautieria morchelliformis]
MSRLISLYRSIFSAPALILCHVAHSYTRCIFPLCLTVLPSHCLVIERTAADHTTDGSNDGYDLSEHARCVRHVKLSFDGWPVRQAWRDELDAVKETHDVNLLPPCVRP